MDPVQNMSVEDETLREVDDILREYGDLLAQIKELKQQALEIYTRVTKEHDEQDVARTLEHILNIPE